MYDELRSKHSMRKLIVAVFVVLCVIGIWRYCAGSRSVDPAKIKDLVTHYDDVFKQHLAEVNQEIGKDIVRYEPIAKDVIPSKMTIQGSHREIGRWLGLVSKDYYGETARDRLRRKPEDEEINLRIIAMYESIYPQYLDLVRGLAETFDLTLEEVDLQQVEHKFLIDMWWNVLQYKQFVGLTDFASMGNGACSIVSCVSDDGRQFIGRNFDGRSDRPHFVVTTNVEGVYRTLGSACYFPYHWVMEGINEKGLFIGVATNESPPAYNAKEPEYPDEPAVQVIHMVRIALDTCATVDEAIERFQSVRIWFPEEVNHLLLADEAGDAAIVEFDRDRNLVAFRRTEPHLILTNTAYQEGIDYVQKHCPRFRNAVAVAANAPVRDLETVSDITQIMRTVVSQLTDGSSRTLWTSYFDISARQMDLRLRSEKFQVPHVFTLDIP
jgi:predicted choloylglycine hydrolase